MPLFNLFRMIPTAKFPKVHYQQGDMDGKRFASAFIQDAAIQAWIPTMLTLAFMYSKDDDEERPGWWDWFSGLFLEPILTFADGIPGLNTLSYALKSGKGKGVLESPITADVERFSSMALRLPGKIKEGKLGDAAWDAVRVGAYAANIPLERPLRDVKKAAEAVGVMDKK
jgi:hypothetical protein